MEFLRSKSINSFKRIVKIKTKEYALNYLLELKSKHTKLDNLVYTELRLQKYLKTDDIPVHEAKTYSDIGLRLLTSKIIMAKDMKTKCVHFVLFIWTHRHIQFNVSKLKRVSQ